MEVTRGDYRQKKAPRLLAPSRCTTHRSRIAPRSTLGLRATHRLLRALRSMPCVAHGLLRVQHLAPPTARGLLRARSLALAPFADCSASVAWRFLPDRDCSLSVSPRPVLLTDCSVLSTLRFTPSADCSAFVASRSPRSRISPRPALDVSFRTWIAPCPSLRAPC